MTKDTERRAAMKAQDIIHAIKNLKELCGDDEELLADMVEGETTVDTFADRVISMIQSDAAMIEALAKSISDMRARKQRFEERVLRLRTLLAHTMAAGSITTLERPTATLTVKKLPPGVIITEEADLPAKFWKRGKPVLDKAYLKAELLQRYHDLAAAAQIGDEKARSLEVERINKERPEIPGATLDNGSISLQVRTS